MSKINKAVIAKLKPCKDRFDNYLKHYSDFNGKVEEFIMLENITYSDKVWVMTKLMTKRQNVKWALACASRWLSIFESRYPYDLRPRKALEAAEAWLNNPSSENRVKARADAYNAFTAAAAADAARAAADAAALSAYAAATASAYAGIAAADVAALSARATEQEVNLILMVDVLNE